MVADFGDLCFARKRDLVEPAGSMKHEGAGNAKFSERLGDESEDVRRKHTEDLRFRSRRICERAEEVEYGLLADLFSRRNGVAGSGMGSRSEK